MQKKQEELPWNNEVEFYDMHSKDIFSRFPFYHHAMVGENEKEFLKYIIAKARITPKSQVVDLGCGSGYLVGKLNGFCNAVGISTSKECIRQAQLNFPGANFEVANMENYSRKGVTHFIALESLSYSNIDETFKNASKNLKSGGIFYIKDYIRKLIETEEEKENREHVQFYWKYFPVTLPEIITIANSHGFSLTEFSDLSGRANHTMYLTAANYHKVKFEDRYPGIRFLVTGEFLFIKI